MVFILSALWWIKIRGLWKIPDGTKWLWGKLGLILMGGAMYSKFLIQFSVGGWGCVPPLLFDLRPNYGGRSEDNGNLLQKAPCMHMLSAPALQQATTPSPWQGCDPWMVRVPSVYINMGKHSSVSVSVGSLGPGAHKICFSPPSISGRYGIWF